MTTKKNLSKIPSSGILRLIFEILGSLAFAIFLIGGLALILIASTTLESIYGTPFVQRFFYQAGWFDVWLALLAVNIVCSALLRYPFKKKHVGFVITHIGILLLLVGSLGSRLLGTDGQMMLFEGEEKEKIVQNSYELIVHSDGQITSFDVALHPGEVSRPLKIQNQHLNLFMHRVWDNAVESTDIKEGPVENPVNHAIELTLTSAMAGAKETLWLVENNSFGEPSDHLEIGPATISLKKKETSEKPTNPKLRIGKKEWENDFLIDLNDVDEEIPLGQTGFKISDLKYYPDAKVGPKNKLMNASPEPLNPAVEFDISDSNGQKEHHIKFALYPDFESMHEKSQSNVFDLSCGLIAGSSPVKVKSSTPSIDFYTDTNPWSYKAVSSKNSVGSSIEAGKTYPAGWMDFKFRVEKLFDRAVVSRLVRRASETEKGQMAVEISLSENDQEKLRDWVLEDKPLKASPSEGEIILALRQKTSLVPFVLTLKDFRKVDYPGTQQAASFESDVRLYDPKEKLTIEKTISMNKPLDYKGYRIFQSSFAQDPMQGEASVFTIAKNPGIVFIYSGAIILFIGIFLTFFVSSFSSIKN